MLRSVVALAAALALPAPALASGGLDASRLRAALERAQQRPSLARLVADVRSSRLDATRRLTFMLTLELNLREPAGRAEVRDSDGLVYRSVPGRGYRFHPLASFGKLNAAVSRGRTAEAHTLAWALLARGRRRGGALVWEYDFPSSGGRAPWTSGLAQAVAAQALARAGFVAEARRAYRAIPASLLLRLPQGPWIRLSSLTRDAVLNAQLQAALSIGAYARTARDRAAARLATRMRTAAGVLLPRFDTGSWSTYALGGAAAPVGYHSYVSSLLWKLGWDKPALRFRKYWRLPPRIRAGTGAGAVFPLPRDGFRDAARVSFWLSKEAAVTLRVAGQRRDAVGVRGWNELRWEPGRRAPGSYPVRIVAVDRAGNSSERRLPPVIVRRDTEPPRLSAEVRASRLVWQGADASTPWLSLQLELARGGGRTRLALGRRKLSGAERLTIPLERTWHATLVAADSAGNSTRFVLGRIGGLGRLPRS